MESNLPDGRQHVIRVGAVQYLNARPLTFCLKEIAPSAELIFDLPSRLAEALKAGLLDVAMIPSIEYFRLPVTGLFPTPASLAAARSAA